MFDCRLLVSIFRALSVSAARSPHSRRGRLPDAVSSLALGVLLAFECSLAAQSSSAASPLRVEFRPGPATVEQWETVDIAIDVSGVEFDNPFTEVEVTGSFGLVEPSSAAGEQTKDEPEESSAPAAPEWAPEIGEPIDVTGFCDSPDGSVYRIRFLPGEAGEYEYRVLLRHRDVTRRAHGAFRVTESTRSGPVRVDPEHPEHFKLEGTDEHFFWTGATALFLAGWDDPDVAAILDRFDAQGVNRVRVLLSGCVGPRPWGTPVVPTDSFSLCLQPWPRAGGSGGFDLERFRVEYWQRFDRLVRAARERGIVVAVVFFLGGPGAEIPVAAGTAEERRFLRYAVSRLAAFPNVMWDLGHEHDLSRESPDWPEITGYTVKAADPYDHLIGAHNRAYRGDDSMWLDMQLLQWWGAEPYRECRREREEQAQTGRLVPTVLDSFGIEDAWERVAGERSADVLRRRAWEIYMAGAYATFAESARQGTGVPPDTGGGWVNGRGDDNMRLLEGIAPIREFFAKFEWWRAEASPHLLEGEGFCLARSGEFYAVYSPRGASARLRLEGEDYRALRWNPRAGEWSELGAANGPVWTIPAHPDQGDWAVLVLRRHLLPDRCPPEVVSAAANAERTRVDVVFSEPVNPIESTLPAQYQFAPHLEVNDVQISADGLVASLEVADIPAGRYSLRTARIADRARPPNARGARSIGHVPIELEVAEVPSPSVYFDLEEGVGSRSLAAAFGSRIDAFLTPDYPRWSANVPHRLIGSFALDFGAVRGPHGVHTVATGLDSGVPLNSFAVTGWINLRGLPRVGGACIVSTASEAIGGLTVEATSGGGVRLRTGRLDGLALLGMNHDLLPVDPDARRENWRFFAVTVRAGTEGRAKLFVGSAGSPAVLVEESAGVFQPVRLGSDPVISLGHLRPELRTPSRRAWALLGMLDDVRVYLSRDGSAFLGETQIRAVQRVGRGTGRRPAVVECAAAIEVRAEAADQQKRPDGPR